MGLENHEGGKFITIFNGKFCQRVDEKTVGAIQRTNKNGKVVFEKYYDSFSGLLVDIKTRESAYGKMWQFDFKDKGEIYHVQMFYSSSFAKAFLKMLPNIDVSKEMKLSPSQKEVDGKNQSSLFVNQNGVAIKHAYTKDNANGMPKMVQVKIKGNLQWDDTDQIEFLHDMVMKDILPKLSRTPVEEGSKETMDEVASDLSDRQEDPF